MGKPSDDTKQLFIKDVLSIKEDISNLVDKLENNMSDKSIFVQLVGKMDKVSTNANALGLNAFCAYTKSLKEMSYLASCTENLACQKKVYRIVQGSLNTLDTLCKSVHDPSIIISIAAQLKIVIGKAAVIERTYFQDGIPARI